MPTLSKRLSEGSESLIGKTFELALQLQAAGRTIHDLSKGEPDFPTDPHVAEAGRQAIGRGFTKYTATDGDGRTKQAIRERLQALGHRHYDDAEIIIGNGGMAVLGHIGMTLLDAGDEVIVPAPYWPSHAGMVNMLQATARFVSCKTAERFKLQPAALRDALSNRTRCLILCSPNNPTGVVYSETELHALADVLHDFPDVWILSDEIYADIVFDGHPHASFAVVCPQLASRTVTLNGVSKGYAMTGWRIAYATGPADVMDGARQIMSHIGGSPSTIAQHATVAALEGAQTSLAERAAEYQQRRDTILSRLQPLNTLTIVAPAGAFYIFVDCTALIGMRTPDGTVIDSSIAFSRYLLTAEGVAVVPGEAFGAPGCFRICFAVSSSTLESACSGLVSAVNALTPHQESPE